jgi:hypothetical protein
VRPQAFRSPPHHLEFAEKGFEWSIAKLTGCTRIASAPQASRTSVIPTEIDASGRWRGLPFSDAGNRAMTSDADRSGRVLGVWTKEPPGGGMLVNVRAVQRAGRAFLIGEWADDAVDGSAKGTIWCPHENATMLNVYHDGKAALEMYAAGSKDRGDTTEEKRTWRFWE